MSSPTIQTTADDAAQDEKRTPDESLLPCPFCGFSRVDVYAIGDGSGGTFYASCEDCGARVGGYSAYYVGSQDAARAKTVRDWNTRAAIGGQTS